MGDEKQVELYEEMAGTDFEGLGWWKGSRGSYESRVGGRVLVVTVA